ncbi:MAG: hypothetical protein KDB27_36485, partial [Planctomycetales bacterium]|nr:hypothetical protein [Planctomycetales bacterium]
MTRLIIGLLLVLVVTTNGRTEDRAPLDGVQRIVFLGDSNTYAGAFVAYVDAVLRQHHDVQIDILNMGLPSETASGLSEPDHPFPRPCVHERLDRVLAKSKPDLVIAGYGINDGIYYPFSEERFAKYRDGISLLVKKVKASGADIILLTPSPFDPSPQRKAGKLRPDGSDKYAWFAVYENYDDVMSAYAKWILQQYEKTVDIRTPLVERTKRGQKDDSGFALSGDGVHFNDE